MHVWPNFQFYGLLFIKATMWVQKKLLLVGDTRKWENAVEEEKCFGALLIDLSKAFDCLFQELLIEKSHAYGFDLPALKLIQSYLSTENKGPKLMRRISHEKKFYLEYCKIYSRSFIF